MGYVESSLAALVMLRSFAYAAKLPMTSVLKIYNCVDIRTRSNDIRYAKFGLTKTADFAYRISLFFNRISFFSVIDIVKGKANSLSPGGLRMTNKPFALRAYYNIELKLIYFYKIPTLPSNNEKDTKTTTTWNRNHHSPSVFGWRRIHLQSQIRISHLRKHTS